MRRLTQMIILRHVLANQLIRILRILIATTHKIATKTIRHEEISSQRSVVRYQRSVIGINHLPKHCGWPDKSAGLSWRDAAEGRAFSGSCGRPESARRWVEASICLEFSCFVLCFKTKNEVGLRGKTPVE